ncbi:MAG TPA: lycopene cyclase family protein, partial [Candidatus Xenobia bacterium]
MGDDLIVVGGGPAGLATALHAAEYGLRPLIVEPRVGVIDKACGEGIMPAGVAELQALDACPTAAWPLRGIRYLGAGQQAEACFANGQGLGIRRSVLHAELLGRARASGLPRVVGKVHRVCPDALGVTVHLDSGEVRRSSWLVAADGLHSRLRRDLGLELAPRWPRRYGMRQHFCIAPWSEFVEVHWSPRAEAYVTPVGPDCVGVAILGRGHQSYPALLAEFPGLAARLVSPCTAVAGGGPFEQRVRRRVVGRVLLVGDAA